MKFKLSIIYEIPTPTYTGYGTGTNTKDMINVQKDTGRSHTH